VLKLVNRSPVDLEVPGSDALHLTDRDGRTYTVRTLAEPGLWHMPATVPAQASLQLEVVVGPGLSHRALSVIRIRGIRGTDPFATCELRSELAEADRSQR